MSNNKQSMKLYTKEDFLKAAEFCEVSMIDAKYIIERIDEVSDPIELPSDEEIGKEFKHSSENWEVRQALEVGAKWMRDKIQGGNNDNP
jgi:hypothetical protein